MKYSRHFFVSILITFAIISIANAQANPYHINGNYNAIYLEPDRIWFQNKDHTSTINLELRLADTNPAFFSLVWNTIRECVFNNISAVLWHEEYIPDPTVPADKYNRIYRIELNRSYF